MPQPSRCAWPCSEPVLVQRAADGDPLARERLIDAFLPRIATVARTYHRLPAVDRAELMQEGVAGLLTALQRFESRRGTPFWAYASWWVREAMQSLIGELSGPVVLSDRASRSLARIRAARRHHLQTTGRDPTASQLGGITGLTGSQVQQLLAFERRPRSLSEPAATDGEPTAGTLGDRIADPRAEDPFERVLDRLQVADLAGLPDRLRARERHVVRARYGFGQPPQTLREIASALRISAERVRQIEGEALDHLRSDVDARRPDHRGARLREVPVPDPRPPGPEPPPPQPDPRPPKPPPVPGRQAGQSDSAERSSSLLRDPPAPRRRCSVTFRYSSWTAAPTRSTS
jgi:RNA polymerase primary sigma factor